MNDYLRKKNYLYLLSASVIIAAGAWLISYSIVNGLSEYRSVKTINIQAVRKAGINIINPEPGSQTILENRLVTVDYPQFIRVGESDNVMLEFLLDPVAEQAAENGKNPSNSTSTGPGKDVFQEFNVLLECRLEMAGMIIRPEELISEPLLPGKSLKFYWNLMPTQAGVQEGTVWIYLRYIPKNGESEIRKAIIAQPVEIKNVSFFG
ncbi:MAG: hypothetical protein WCP19_15115, partial [Chloroflexota bacterium]